MATTPFSATLPKRMATLPNIRTKDLDYYQNSKDLTPESEPNIRSRAQKESVSEDSEAESDNTIIVVVFCAVVVTAVITILIILSFLIFFNIKEESKPENE